MTRPTRLALLLLLLAGATALNAQPTLNLKRVVANWPKVELFFSPSCAGQLKYVYDPQQLRVRENGVDVAQFQLSCPDSAMRYPISVALVFDASGSMSGSGNAGARAAGNAFVDLMDGVVDEAAVMWFTGTITVAQGMTTYLDLLHNAINGLPAAGATALWDGLYSGITEVANNGVNAVKAVIVIADGEDNASALTAAQVITVARNRGVRVFTVGIGTQFNMAQLQDVAAQTGGRHYAVTNPAQLTAILQEIATLLFRRCNECTVAYTAECKDGGTRTVDLTLANFCGGSDTKSGTYTAPRDTVTFQPITISAGKEIVTGSADVAVPLLLNSPVTAVFAGAQFTVLYDDANLQLLSAATPPGTLLAGVPVDVQAVPGGATIRTLANAFVDAVLTPAPLLTMTFRSADRIARDTVRFPLVLKNWTFAAGCFAPVLQNGELAVVSVKPRVFIDGSRSMCAGDARVLSGRAGMTAYRWSTGDTTLQITVRAAGAYHYSARNAGGQTILSDTLVVSVRPLPVPVVTPADTTYICQGDTARFALQQAFKSVVWSNGSTAAEIATGTAGDYTATVTDDSGCVGVSKPVYVRYRPLARPVITGPASSCPMAEETYSTIILPGRTLNWLASGGVILSRYDSSTVRVRWNPGVAGRIVVQAFEGRCRLSDWLDVRLDVGPKPLLSVGGRRTLCAGDSARLDAGAGYAAYLWSTGDTTRAITVGRGGAYFVRVRTASGCQGNSDTARITVLPPLLPRIAQAGNLLSTDSAATYQWFKDGAPIPGATSRGYRISESGSYTVAVVDSNGCTGTSLPYSAVYTGIAGIAPASLAVDWYPQPVRGDFTLRIAAFPGLGDATGLTADLRITDLLGRLVYAARTRLEGGDALLRVPFTAPPPGVYAMTLSAGDRREVFLVLKAR